MTKRPLKTKPFKAKPLKTKPLKTKPLKTKPLKTKPLKKVIQPQFKINTNLIKTYNLRKNSRNPPLAQTHPAPVFFRRRVPLLKEVHQFVLGYSLR